MLLRTVQGFQWTNEGTESNPRWGYVSSMPADYITLQVGSNSGRQDMYLLLFWDVGMQSSSICLPLGVALPLAGKIIQRAAL